VRRTAIVTALAAVLLAGCGGSDPASAPETTAATTSPVADEEQSGATVLLLGDSLMEELAGPLRHAVELGGGDRARFVLGPALPHSEADVALWQRQVEGARPDVVVLHVGHWEYLRVLGDFATGARVAPGTYRTEVVDRALSILREAGTHVLWLSPLPIRDAGESAFTGSLGEVYRAALAGRSDAEYVDVRGAGFDPEERRPDGIHLCPDGQLRVARTVVGHLRPHLTHPPPPDWGRAWRRTAREPGGCAPYSRS